MKAFMLPRGMLKKSNDRLIISFFILLFILIRSVYFDNRFNFVYDQVASATKVLELWKTKSISLIGPHMSFTVEGRQVFFGGFSYLMDLAFLLIGRFDPFRATYAFMLFCAAMIIPLYIGTKKLINKQAALIMIILYTLFPFFIESTSQLWNPYYMFSLFPFMVYLMGLFKKNKSWKVFLLFSIMCGVCFQLHYLFMFTWLGLAAYYFLFEKLSKKFLALYLIGFAIGMGNLIIFEVRNNFYLLQTLWIFINHPSDVSEHWIAPYYLLSQVFFGMLLILALFRKKIVRDTSIGIFLAALLFAIPYITTRARERSYPKGWSYENEQEVYRIIKENLKTYNDVNIFTFYDATGNAPKYFLKRDNIALDYDDYYRNKYLYVTYPDDTYFENAAYEVASFRPSKLVKTWKINETYSLYLLERL